MKYKLKDVLPNPFRRINEYPIRPEKVRALRESLKTTGFWDNIVARSNGNGRAEIAYGHHRLVALREEYGPSHEINLVIRPLDDTAMLQIMARENLEEWGTSAWIEMETVRAVVDAYGTGKIELGAPDKSTSRNQLRYAPSFVTGADAADARPPRPYTGQTVAEFLGWLEPSGKPKGKVNDALAALELIEEGVLQESVFAGLSTRQAQTVVEQAREARAAKERERREAEQEAKRRAAEAERAKAEAARRAAEAERAQTEAKRRVAEAAQARAEGERRKAAAAAQEAEREARRAQQIGQQLAKKHATAVSAALRKGASVHEAKTESRIQLAAEGVKRQTTVREKKKREDNPREVREYLEAIRTFRDATQEAVKVARFGKFSPEAARFTARKLDDLCELVEKLKGAFHA